jgi:hypothetical protein
VVYQNSSLIFFNVLYSFKMNILGKSSDKTICQLIQQFSYSGKKKEILNVKALTAACR